MPRPLAPIIDELEREMRCWEAELGGRESAELGGRELCESEVGGREDAEALLNGCADSTLSCLALITF